MSYLRFAMIAVASLCFVDSVSAAGGPMVVQAAVLPQAGCGTSTCGPIGCVPTYGGQIPTVPAPYQSSRPATFGWPAMSYYGAYNRTWGNPAMGAPTYFVPSPSMGPVYPTGSYALPGYRTYYVPQLGYPTGLPVSPPAYQPVPARTNPAAIPPTSPVRYQYPVTRTAPVRSQPASVPGSLGLDSPFYP